MPHGPISTRRLDHMFREHFPTMGVTYRGIESIPMKVRDASPEDAEACLEIYAPYVKQTTVTFESEPPSIAEMKERIIQAVRVHAWLLLEDGRGLIGFAKAGTFRSRSAYRWSCETSVYLDRARQRSGGGRTLYDSLFTRLANRGYYTALAGMTTANVSSIAFHSSLGFETVGTYRRIGWKHGEWHDVIWMQRVLRSGVDPPSELI